MVPSSALFATGGEQSSAGLLVSAQNPPNNILSLHPSAHLHAGSNLAAHILLACAGHAHHAEELGVGRNDLDAARHLWHEVEHVDQGQEEALTEPCHPGQRVAVQRLALYKTGPLWCSGQR